MNGLYAQPSKVMAIKQGVNLNEKGYSLKGGDYQKKNQMDLKTYTKTTGGMKF